MPNTTNLSLPYPLTTDTAAVPRDVEALADAVDAVLKTSERGALSGRPVSSAPSPGIAGRFYFATDEGVLYQDTGTGWQAVGVSGANEADPAGRIEAYANAVAPIGWLLCDGSLYNTATYTRLAPVIGSTYTLGGDAAGTFRVPDLRGRSIMGAGSGSGLTTRTLGSIGGSETHPLTSGQIPAHTHSGTTDSVNRNATHNHELHRSNQSPYIGTDLSNMYRIQHNSGGSVSGYTTQAADTDHEHTFITTTDSTGGGTHPNVHPFGVLSYIIRY